VNEPQRLTEDQIAAYQREARKTLLGKGYNLFAEISLRLIDQYYALLAEMENLRNLRAERNLESEFLTRENEDLRAQVAALEQTKTELTEQVEELQAELERLKRNRVNLPPSWT
jgi:chromosome segregation ATPase